MKNSEPTADILSSDELQSLEGLEAAPSGEPSFRFVQRCQDWLEAWLDANKYPLEKGEVPSSQVLMFIFAEAPDIERPTFKAIESQWKRFFPGSHDQSAQGVIMSNENFLTMYNIYPEIGSLGGAFQLVADHLKSADTFAIVQLSQRRLLFHSPGGSIEEWCADPTVCELRLSTDPLSAAKIAADVDEFHEEHLRNAKSTVAKTLWKGKNYPYQLHPAPEQTIQIPLYLHLRASYKHLKGIVDEETSGKGGRCDIRVMWNSLAGAPFHPFTTTMLELKVLYEAQGATKHREWALSGITQANDYRLPDSEAVYACVFDARKDQTDKMLDLDPIAAAMNVQLRRYSMEPPDYDKKPKAPAKAAKKAGKKATIKRAKKISKKAIPAK
ncbi:MAG: hypothetical protein ABI858_06490 [Pseudoxanthomonas sp.]